MEMRIGSEVFAIIHLEAMIAVLLLLVTAVFTHSVSDESWDVRQHLSTVSRYGVVKDITDDSFVPSLIPDGCIPIHLNLVARHGTRAPTKKKICKLNQLAHSLQMLIKNATENKLLLLKVPDWLFGWKSPWKAKVTGGELIREGEDELYDLAIRTRERFPDIFNGDYHPDMYKITATQVSRASASAVAFGIGLFSGRGSLGLGKQQAFAVTSESRASDIMLRFYDTCQKYKDFRKTKEPAVEKLKEPIFDEIKDALVARYELNFTRQDISSLWFLCKQEASLLGITNQACGLFLPLEVAFLEWTDDIELFILKGYGNSLNYRIGVPLLRDVVESMERAIEANEGAHPRGSYEKARLRFAHAETVVPFSCLLGLFQEGAEHEMIQREQPLELPPRPPKKRSWKGSMVAPFAGNNMLVLYSCPANSSSKYYVQVLHNEHPIRMPGCNDSDFCSFEVFQQSIVAPHLKDDFNTICNVKSYSNDDTRPELKPKPNKEKSLFHSPPLSSSAVPDPVEGTRVVTEEAAEMGLPVVGLDRKSSPATPVLLKQTVGMGPGDVPSTSPFPHFNFSFHVGSAAPGAGLNSASPSPSLPPKVLSGLAMACPSPAVAGPCPPVVAAC
ncbi:hypothetical protein Nepgr_032392 [Nepenthes gracilis]|uniref:Multiple inositol polyphosphate phosphatase 1 n=1 Tax=Nepenthes gracilis TaxID=150966 RepID=A0AAD3TJX3_NEPGR|nr:hypothetical protein Nepgr_032392 [Nepenthes gracilis]